jgi:hypothetical protein
MVLAVAIATAVCLAGNAWASPVTFFFDSGSAHVTATRSSDNSIVVSETVALDGVFVEFDAAVPELVDFDISAAMTGAISMLQPWGGFDTFVIESASITPGVAYSSIFVSMIGPTQYSFLVGPVDVDGVYSAFNSGGPPPLPVMNVPVPFVGASFLNGTIDTDSMVLELLGITLAEIPGAAFGETDNLLIKADITWTGAVPEPGTSILVGLGLFLLASRRRIGVE